MTKRFACTRALFFGLLLVSGLFDMQAVWGRDPWQIQHPPMPPGGQPGATPVPLGLVPKVTPDFWRRMQAAQVPYGTVLNTVLQEDISSKTSVNGQHFHLLLADGFSRNGVLVIPPGALIDGCVHTAVPAARLDHGNPGRLEVSLKSLVFPDGKTLAISGFIEHNPNADPKDPQAASKVHYTGASISSYGSMFTSFLGSFTRGIGVLNRKYNRGADFTLVAGTPVRVCLTQSLKIPQQANSLQWATQSPAQPTVPGLAGKEPTGLFPSGASNLLPGNAPGIPGISAPASSGGGGGHTAPAFADPTFGVNESAANPLSRIPDPF